MLSLDVAISTYKPEGIKRVEKMLESLPEQPNVNYVVSWQEHANADIPVSLLKRGDVKILRYDIKGLSNNRNNAIDHCTGDILLIADDDLNYRKDFAASVIKPFAINPTLDMALFKIEFKNKKSYPRQECEIKLPLPKNYYVTSMEIAFRRESFRDLRFYPELGLGAADMHCGEEELFLISAIKRGLNLRFIDKIIAGHPEETTGDKVSEDILRGQGFVIGALYPFTWWMRVPLKALRNFKSKKSSLAMSLRYLAQGAVRYKTSRKSIPKKYH